MYIYIYIYIYLNCYSLSRYLTHTLLLSTFFCATCSLSLLPHSHSLSPPSLSWPSYKFPFTRSILPLSLNVSAPLSPAPSQVAVLRESKGAKGRNESEKEKKRTSCCHNPPHPVVNFPRSIWRRRQFTCRL